MNLGALRAEVLATGFDTPVVSNARANRYINDGYLKMVRRVSYYVDEATLDFGTVAGTATYPQPADFAKDRSLRFTGTFTGELQSVGLRTIDRSVVTSGAPYAYAIDGTNLHLYPTPNSIYTLELRYWKLPPLLVADGDTPTIPDDYSDALIYYGVARCYKAEEDIQTAAQYMQDFNTRLAEFAADVKFPDDNQASQIADFWQGPPTLNRGWTRSGYWE